MSFWLGFVAGFSCGVCFLIGAGGLCVMAARRALRKMEKAMEIGRVFTCPATGQAINEAICRTCREALPPACNDCKEKEGA